MALIRRVLDIPGVDYGKVKYPDLMDDIDSLYDELKAARDKPEEEKEKVQEEVKKKLKETTEKVEEVHEQVEEHKKKLKENVTKEAKIEHLTVGDCRDAFAHKDLSANLARMHPQGTDPALGGIIEYDVEKMCETCAPCSDRECVFTKKEFVQCFMNMLEQHVGTAPLDCEAFAYQVMSGDLTMELETDNEELAVRNLAISKELVRLRKGPLVPAHLRHSNRTSLDKLAPKHPNLQDVVRKGFTSVRDMFKNVTGDHWPGISLLTHLSEGEKEKGLPEGEIGEDGHMKGTHEGIGDASDALDSSDHDSAMDQMEALKEHMEETHDEMKEDVQAHQANADQVIVSREKYEESLGQDGMGKTMRNLGFTKEEAMKQFDDCDAKDDTPGDGKMFEKDFLECQLRQTEDEAVLSDKTAASGNGINVSASNMSADPHCFGRIKNLISGHLYMDSREINAGLRRKNTELHKQLRIAYDVFAEAEANLTAQLLKEGNITTLEAQHRANETWHARHLPVLDDAHAQVVHFSSRTGELTSDRSLEPVGFGRQPAAVAASAHKFVATKRLRGQMGKLEQKKAPRVPPEGPASSKAKPKQIQPKPKAKTAKQRVNAKAQTKGGAMT